MPVRISAIDLRSGALLLVSDGLAEPEWRTPMSARTSIRLAGLASAAIATTLLAGCGSSAGGSATTGGGGTQPQSGNSGGGGTSTTDGIGHPVNVCSLLPAATVASVTGEPLTVAQEQDTASYKLWTCDYTSADGTSGLTISVLALDAAPGYDAALQADTNAKQITGLGDKAFSGVLGLQALFGNVSISVSDVQSDAAAETLIRDLQPKL